MIVQCNQCYNSREATLKGLESEMFAFDHEILHLRY